MQTNEYKLDWLSISLVIIPKNTQDYTTGQPNPDIEGFLGPLIDGDYPRIAHYTHGMRYKYGTVYRNERDRTQKDLIVISGDDFTAYAVDKNNPKALLFGLMMLPEANVTRLDFAIDVKNSGGAIQQLHDMWKEGKIRTSAKQITPFGKEGVGGEDLGKTLYFGSRQSERMIRVYDKGKQLETQEDWLRIEIELKGRWAHQTAKDMAYGDLLEVGKAVVRQFVMCDLEWYRNAVWSGRTGVYVQPEKRPETDHEKWLREICVPAVIKAISSDMMWVEDSVLKAILAKHRGEDTVRE